MVVSEFISNVLSSVMAPPGPILRRVWPRLAPVLSRADTILAIIDTLVALLAPRPSITCTCTDIAIADRGASGRSSSDRSACAWRNIQEPIDLIPRRSPSLGGITPVARVPPARLLPCPISHLPLPKISLS